MVGLYMHEIWSVDSKENLQICYSAYSALPDPLAGFEGPTSKGSGGETPI